MKSPMNTRDKNLTKHKYSSIVITVEIYSVSGFVGRRQKINSGAYTNRVVNNGEGASFILVRQELVEYLTSNLLVFYTVDTAV